VVSPDVVAYGIGDMAITIGMALFGLYVLFFYTTVMKLPAALAGAGAAAGLIWDAIVDPYIGHWSDNHRSRLGRRHGFMVVGAVLSGVALWALLSPPAGLSTPLLFAWLLGTTLVFRFTSAIFRVPYLALGAELSDDYHGRTVVVGVRAFFGLAGTLAAATLSFMLFFPPVAGADPKLVPANYSRLALVFGIAMALAGLVGAAGTWKHRHLGDAAAAHAEPRHFAAAFASAWRLAPFRRLWLAFTLFFLAVVLNASLAIHYLTWYAGIADTAVFGRIQLSFYTGALLGIALWVPMAKRVEKRTLCIASIASTAIFMSLATLAIGEGRLFGTGNPAPLFAGNLLAGLCAAGVWILPASMLADVADLDHRHWGRRREGLLFGLINFGEKVGAGVALLLAGVLLDLFVGPIAPPVGPRATLRIGILYGIAPALLLVCAALTMIGYRLDRSAVVSIQSGGPDMTPGLAAPRRVANEVAMAQPVRHS
jgi:GPH family glycoside/pentoside/hexuronide:cation symporter